MENLNNEENNIETIEVKKDGVLSLQPLVDITQECMRASKICEVMMEATKEISISIINSVGLNGIDFKMLGTEELKTALFRNAKTFPPIILTGLYNAERYVLRIMFNPIEQTKETSLPEGAFVTLCRFSNESEWKYDFMKKSWEELSYFEQNGYTKNQMDLLQHHKDDPRTLLLRHFGPGNEDLTDDELQQVYLMNKEILNLYKRTQLFTTINKLMLFEYGKVILTPLETDAKNGFAVTYENNEFCLNTYTYRTILKTVYKTPDMYEMESILVNMLDRKFRQDLLSFVPVSSNTAVLIYKTGECEYMCPYSDKHSISDKEKEIFEDYKRICVDIAAKMKKEDKTKTDSPTKSNSTTIEEIEV